MKRKLLIVIYIIVILVVIKLLYNTVLNSILISKYNNGEYATNIGKTLTTLNFPQSYVANYNYGNILYQNGEYEDAIDQYKIALNVSIPEKKECKVRINYALALCKTVELDESSEESILKAIQIYESAIDVLIENGCANKDDNGGHSKEAEQLKKDIQKEIDRLKELLQNGSDESKEENDDKEDESQQEESNQEKEMEQKIQDIKEDATKEQRSKENKYKNYQKEVNKNKKNW